MVGLEVNANHLRSARDGEVRGICCALHYWSPSSSLANRDFRR
ncbi:esterase YdiI domain protein [Candidatus Erwinia dacicola]|uniref:Esterase YdiI domain protein n=1 Tax=Candidatus Erwinia dacicola TaxID=252393 RepID=A0A328TVM8_9GAMM|nr:esterase YdiI domain protein [Candidatus Erwinia dacicola]